MKALEAPDSPVARAEDWNAVAVEYRPKPKSPGQQPGQRDSVTESGDGRKGETVEGKDSHKNQRVTAEEATTTLQQYR